MQLVQVVQLEKSVSVEGIQTLSLAIASLDIISFFEMNFINFWKSQHNK